MDSIWEQFVAGMQGTTWLEYLAVFSGIVSVWFSRKENILVYPTGLFNTIIYIYISIKANLFGEASVNLYYTILSIYGWWMWSLRNNQHEHVVKITFSNKRWWVFQIAFFLSLYIIIFVVLHYLKQIFYANTIPWADAFASASAFTGMYLMTKKKIESWYWWIATNIASIPLYFTKHYVFTSVYYLILLAMAIMGLIEWRRRYYANLK